MQANQNHPGDVSLPAGPEDVQDVEWTDAGDVDVRRWWLGGGGAGRPMQFVQQLQQIRP